MYSLSSDSHHLYVIVYVIRENTNMLAVIFWYGICSPLLPMIYLFIRYFKPGSNRLMISLIMLAVCAAFIFLGSLYADHAHGFDGLRALGAIWGGFGGAVLSVILLIINIVRAVMH